PSSFSENAALNQRAAIKSMIVVRPFQMPVTSGAGAVPPARGPKLTIALRAAIKNDDVEIGR
ncbi:MAG: hypothetical protein WCK55_19060, partial [Verrucomicrobiota bacterium]